MNMVTMVEPDFQRYSGMDLKRRDCRVVEFTRMSTESTRKCEFPIWIKVSMQWENRV